jgi:ribosomal-protein-serine acetyltransferase
MDTTDLPDLLLTPRLTLRHWTVDDIPDMSRAIAESLDHLRPWMGWIDREPLSQSQRVELIGKWDEEWSSGRGSTFGMWQDGVVVGSIGMHRRDGPGSIEIGYWVHVDHVGRGYATEAARALTEAAFEVPGIERVEIYHDVTNEISSRIPQRLGYVMSGERRREPEAPSETGIDLRWVATRSRWPG